MGINDGTIAFKTDTTVVAEYDPGMLLTTSYL